MPDDIHQQLLREAYEVRRVRLIKEAAQLLLFRAEAEVKRRAARHDVLLKTAKSERSWRDLDGDGAALDLIAAQHYRDMLQLTSAGMHMTGNAGYLTWEETAKALAWATLLPS